MKRLLVFFLVMVSLTLPSYAKIVDYIVAVVNGEPILYSELLDYAKTNRINNLKAARDSLIERKILLTEAKSEGLAVSDEELNRALENFIKNSGFKSKEEFEKALKKEGLTLEEVKEKLKEQLLVAKLIGRNVKSKIRVSDIEVEKVCKEKKKKPVREVYYIYVKDKQKANRIMEILDSGIPFEKVAKEYSEDKATAQNGGYLGKVTKGSLIKPLDIAVWSTKPKTYKLVETKGGYYIIYVKKEEIEKCDKNRIREELYVKKFQKALKDYIDSLKSKASVKVYL
ncbi:peptidylprolyl isomerase [Desulfurobacterium thermolithotrophum]|uniref:peptidylprolyl isomerase n=1 Tax=Desulfurobacterium thermolithotrophum TaxID=64160 RepID=UPI0013D5BED7|nr:peptidylprolyl isomerase [Desulfurobacterium thermolithotrophum]